MEGKKGCVGLDGASVWRVGRTAEDRLMYRRSIKAATSGNVRPISEGESSTEFLLPGIKGEVGCCNTLGNDAY